MSAAALEDRILPAMLTTRLLPLYYQHVLGTGCALGKWPTRFRPFPGSKHETSALRDKDLAALCGAFRRFPGGA